MVAMQRHRGGLLCTANLCARVGCVNGKLLGKKPCPLSSWEHWLGVELPSDGVARGSQKGRSPEALGLQGQRPPASLGTAIQFLLRTLECPRLFRT